MTVYHNIGYMLKLHKIHIIIKYCQTISKTDTIKQVKTITIKIK